MKKILLAASLAAVCSFGWAQTGEVPPDYPAQAAQYQTNPVDAQIEAVRRNYEDVKARAQMRLDAEKRAKEEREAAQAKVKARERARAQTAADARAKEAARKAAKQEKYQDEERELELEMKRLDVRSKKSDIETKEAINREKARRANEIVERMLESDSPAKTRERSY